VATAEEPERKRATDPRVAARLPAGTQVLRKPTFGLAGTPEILEAVRATGRTTAIIVGCETDVCVAQSAIGLRDEGFACVVVEDATFSPGKMHERGLMRIIGEGIPRNHAKGVPYEWLRTVDDAHVVLSDRLAAAATVSARNRRPTPQAGAGLRSAPQPSTSMPSSGPRSRALRRET
jgi:Isochorismatase family